MQNGGTGSATLGGQIMPLDELSKKLEVIRERVSQSAGRVRSIADTLFGSQPEPGATSNNLKSSTAGRMSGLNDGADAALGWLSELEAQIGRLSPLG